MKMMAKSMLTVMAMLISLSSVNGRHPPPPFNPEACIANFTGVCRYPSTSLDLARCCVFLSDLMKNEDQHPCLCSLFSNFTYEYALSYLLDCKVNVTGFNFCPDLRGSPKLPPPTPRRKILQSPQLPLPTYNATRKPPPLKPQETPPPKTTKSLVVVIAVCSVVVLVLIITVFFFWRKKSVPSPEDVISSAPDPEYSGTTSQIKNTFTYKELVEATDDFSDENFIAQGGSAHVYRGLLKDGRVVAVRRLMAVGEEAEKEFRNEIEMLGGLPPHQHVVSLIGHCITPQKRILVYEFVPNGSLHSHLHEKKDTIIDWSTRMKIAIGSARGIAYLHEPGGYPTIIHRDIKSANILLDENFEAKIAGIKIYKWKLDDMTHVTTRIMGTAGYIDPEYFATERLTPMADIYSFGAVIVELITGQIPGARLGHFKDPYIDWVKPSLLRSILQDQNYDAIADPRLNGAYNHDEMERMVACAASCIQRNPRLRPQMGLIIRILKGGEPVNALNLDTSISSSLSERDDSSPQWPGNSGYTYSEYSGTTSQIKNTFTYKELVQATDDFSDANFIAQGGFAQVYRGLLKDGRVVAVKRLMAAGEDAEKEFRNEIKIIGGLPPHQHVVSLIGHCVTLQRRILVYEFVPNGSLRSHLHEKKDTVIDWSTRMKIAIGSARGIAYLHEPKLEGNQTIIHRDIKSANILLDENYEAKVADFGISKWKPDDKTHVITRVIGTLGYLDPEYEATEHVTPMADIYSFGAVIVELITGQIPGARREPQMAELYIDWVKPFLLRSLKDQNYDAIADPRLNGAYNHNEMERMVACGASCIQRNPTHRPRMGLIIRILEGGEPVNALNLDMSISSSSSERIHSPSGQEIQDNNGKEVLSK